MIDSDVRGAVYDAVYGSVCNAVYARVGGTAFEVIREITSDNGTAHVEVGLAVSAAVEEAAHD